MRSDDYIRTQKVKGCGPFRNEQICSLFYLSLGSGCSVNSERFKWFQCITVANLTIKTLPCTITASELLIFFNPEIAISINFSVHSVSAAFDLSKLVIAKLAKLGSPKRNYIEKAKQSDQFTFYFISTPKNFSRPSFIFFFWNLGIFRFVILICLKACTYKSNNISIAIFEIGKCFQSFLKIYFVAFNSSSMRVMLNGCEVKLFRKYAEKV